MSSEPSSRLTGFYANITLQGPAQRDVIAHLRDRGVSAYVSPTVKRGTVVFHEHLGAQEQTAAGLSAHLNCPALLVMGYGPSALLYQLYVDGEQADAYVSSPHDGLDLGDHPSAEGNAAVLGAAFGVEMNHLVARIDRILRKPTRPDGDYALAVNRHGELARALGLPVFAAGAGFNTIEIGELPAGEGFDSEAMVRTP